jgi:hypothetical protein
MLASTHRFTQSRLCDGLELVRHSDEVRQGFTGWRWRLGHTRSGSGNNFRNLTRDHRGERYQLHVIGTVAGRVYYYDKPVLQIHLNQE